MFTVTAVTAPNLTFNGYTLLEREPLRLVTVMERLPMQYLPFSLNKTRATNVLKCN